MPHAVPTIPFQAIILCGPGSSFPTFTTQPEKNPKALLPVANRPMVWYPINFCYQQGITDITLIAPPSSAEAITAALNTNPHLTGLPLPKPDLLAPKDLEHNTGTAEIFRLPEVREIIKGNFLVLPCDLVCEIGGESLVEAWMIKEATLKGVSGKDPKEQMGGLGVWYETKGESIVKGEESDFIMTTAIEATATPASSFPILQHVSNLVYSLPTDTLNDITEKKKTFPIRQSLLRKHPQTKMFTSRRDAHIYLFPAWVIDMINRNEHMDSVGEDVVGWWAKAGWQDGLAKKLGLDETFKRPNKPDLPVAEVGDTQKLEIDDYSTLSTTKITGSKKDSGLTVPPFLAYIHPSNATTLIRRADTGPLLLSISLQLAKLASVEEAVKGEVPSPFAHQSKVAYPTGIAQRTTVTKADCLLAENVIVEEKSAIKECVIGANCHIKTGAKLTRCVLMDGVVVGKGSKLTGCILGRRAEIGEDSVLTDCEVQENLIVPAKTEDKNNKIMSTEGMEATEEELLESFDDLAVED